MSDTAGGTPQWDAPLGQRPRGLSPTITAIAQGVLWLVATVALLAAVVVAWLARTYQRWRADGSPTDTPSPTSMTEPFDFSRLDALDRAEIAAFLAICVVSLSAIVVMVTMMVWMAQASTAAAERQPPGRRWAGPWPIVGWLIPLASFVLPRLAMGEIERIATTATGTDGRVQPDWRLTRPSSTGRLWWACWVAAPIALAYGDPVERLWAKASADPGRQYWAYALLGAAMLLWSISAAAGAVTVRRVGRHLAR
jgi:hypothetical protein